jgi:hypothetical protein
VISHLNDGVIYGGDSQLDLTAALKLSFSSEVDEDKFVERAYKDICLRFNQSENFERILKVLTND